MHVVNKVMNNRLGEGLVCLMAINLATLAILAVCYLIAFTWTVSPLTLIGWGALAFLFYKKVLL
jgi:hypothetical protein